MTAVTRQFAEIFIVVDPTTMMQPAFLRAEAIAALNGARLTLYCCIAGGHEVEDQARINAQQELTSDWLERIAQKTQSLGIRTQVIVDSANDWRTRLVEASLAAEPDLVVKAASKHSAMGRMFSATADWMLLNKGRSPLLLVSEAPPRAVRRILAAIKLKPDNREQELLNHEIIEMAHYVADVAGFEMYAATAFRGDEIYFDRQKFADSCKLPRDHVRAVEGHAHHAIAAAADDIGADTIVIGNPDKSEVARRLIDQVNADLLILPG